MIAIGPKMTFFDDSKIKFIKCLIEDIKIDGIFAKTINGKRLIFYLEKSISYLKDENFYEYKNNIEQAILLCSIYYNWRGRFSRKPLNWERIGEIYAQLVMKYPLLLDRIF